jgi:peptidoglycan/xylan/chitin deacetylase (PgdA/CDA1 family)/membrane-associated phospholipid phosphatase
MRIANQLTCIFIVLACLGVARAQAGESCNGNDHVLGVSRTIAVDPREHVRIGTMQYHESLPLADHEIVITFDDGPSPKYTSRILDILAAECVKATFLMVGEMAKAHPDEVKRVFAAGHTIGTHSFSHPFTFRRMTEQQAGKEIDAGIEAVQAALGDPGEVAPFFRVPGFLTAKPTEAALAARGLMTWSADFPADDWKNIGSAEVVKRAMSRIEAMGRGILLLHDIHERTVEALPVILSALKAGGYHIVHVVPANAQVARTETTPEQWVLSRHHSGEQIASTAAEPAKTAESNEPAKHSTAAENPPADSPGFSDTNLTALRGLAPVSALQGSDVGKSALESNLAVTTSIQHGKVQYDGAPTFVEQQQQALRDAFITDGNAWELADGLGTALGLAYRKRATFNSPDNGHTKDFSNLSPAIARLFAFTTATTRSDSASGKYFFANGTIDSSVPAPTQARAILSDLGGVVDIFGVAYRHPAGSAGAGAYGNARPFQTMSEFAIYNGNDFFGAASTNVAWLRGPSQNLTNSPSYPSGHTTHGYAEGVLLGLLVPERYAQMIARAAEYGNSRIVIGAHYAMDVIGGRTLALYDLAQLLANKPGYAGASRAGIRIDDFRKELMDARLDAAKVLADECGVTVAECADRDRGRFADPITNTLLTESTQTYGLPVVFPENAGRLEDVSKVAPEAGYLLTTAFPYLTLEEADNILTVTEGPGGGFLDNGSAFGVYSRLDLGRAVQKAIAMAPASISLQKKMQHSMRP